VALARKSDVSNNRMPMMWPLGLRQRIK
jgi:hypothetical protein